MADLCPVSLQTAKELLIYLHRDFSKWRLLVMFAKLICVQLADHCGTTELNVTKVKMLLSRCRVWVMGFQVKRIGAQSANLRLRKLMGVCIWLVLCAPTNGAGLVAYLINPCSTMGNLVVFFASWLVRLVSTIGVQFIVTSLVYFSYLSFSQ